MARIRLFHVSVFPLSRSRISIRIPVSRLTIGGFTHIRHIQIKTIQLRPRAIIVLASINSDNKQQTQKNISRSDARE